MDSHSLLHFRQRLRTHTLVGLGATLLREILGASTRFGFSVAEVDTQRETEQAGAIDLRLRVTGRASVTGLVATLSELDGVLTVGAGEPEDESE